MTTFIIIFTLILFFVFAIDSAQKEKEIQRQEAKAREKEREEELRNILEKDKELHPPSIDPFLEEEGLSDISEMKAEFEADRRSQGTSEERERFPELNTVEWDQHWRRLEKFRRSKFFGEMEYLGPRGGRYVYSARGNRIYR